MKMKLHLPFFGFTLLSVLGFVLTGNAFEDNEDLHVKMTNAESYTQVMPNLTDDEYHQFLHGRSLFKQAWTISPSEDKRTSGLGPLYNRFSCVACHLANGRGFAPNGPEQTMKAMLVRLSVKPETRHDVVKPHPSYGDQLNDFGVPGVAGEGRAVIRYSETLVRLSGGKSVSLRMPSMMFENLAYGSISPENTLTSARIAPAMIGMGLLDAIDEPTILQLAAQQKSTNMAGKPNYVWDAKQNKMVIGKFGWKANVPNLKQQIASAFVGDLGITSTIFKHHPCTAMQLDCLAMAKNVGAELADDQLDAIDFYHRALAVPSARNQQDSDVILGAKLFNEAKCAVCHVTEMKIAGDASYAKFRNKIIRPYTDLLLHDMGIALADNRPDFLASGQEWRTAPLWGIGLAKIVNEKAGYLHDGRARSILEAVLWHDGEAAESRELVVKMTPVDRKALIKFVESI